MRLLKVRIITCTLMVYIWSFFMVSTSIIYAQNSLDKNRLNYLLETTKYYQNRDIRDSINFKNLLELERNFSDITDVKLKAQAARNIGSYYRTIYSYQTSKSYLLKAINLSKQINDWKEVIEEQKNLATVYRVNYQYDELKAMLDSCLQITIDKKLGESILIPLMELTIYNSYDTHNYEEGIKYGSRFKKEVRYYDKLGLDSELFNYRKETEVRIINLELAKCYIMLNRQMDSVIPYLKDAYKFFEPFDDHEKLARISHQFVNYYLKSKNLKKANDFMEKLMYHKRERESQELLRVNEMPSYIESFNNLKADLKLSQVENEQLFKLNKLYTSFLFAIILIGLGVAIYSYNNKKVKLKLLGKVKVIQTLINEDLHDNFGNNLAAIETARGVLKDIIEKRKNNKDETLDKFLDVIERRMIGLNIDIKDLIWANREGNNKLSKITERITYLAGEFTSMNNFSVKVSVKLLKDIETPSLWNRQLILIVKEAMNNSFKHSGESSMQIFISYQGAQFQMICKDAGSGFNMNKLKRKSGLTNMQKRAESINCNLKINSSGSGTEILLQGFIPRY